MTTLSTVWVADSVVSGFFSGTNGTSYAVGAETDCDGTTHLVLWKVTEKGLQIFFRDDSIVSTQGRHGLVLSDSELLLVGTSTRVTDIRRHEERHPGIEKYLDFRPTVSYSEKETDDLLILVLSPDGSVSKRVVVPFGGNVYVNGLLRTGWGLSAYGAVAGQGAFIDLKVPQ
jgi:hypothetical protein